jgi:hypothetical protein
MPYALCVLLVGLLIACGASGNAQQAPPIDSAAPAAEPSPTPPLQPNSRVRAILEASCRLGPYNAEVEIDYHALGEGSSRLSRVRLLVNGRIELDTGAMSEGDLIGKHTLLVVAGKRYMVQLLADSPGAAPTLANSIVRCPAAPKGPRL